jgi:hypothetical protein
VIARPEYVPAGHRTHAVLAGTSEYVPAAHEQHALVAFSPSSVAFPVCVSSVCFSISRSPGSSPFLYYGANRRAPKKGGLPVTFLYFGAHVSFPITPYFPAAHSTHVPPLGPE